ncbi:MAG: NlpC/P60 family protein [Peptostreptococcaceae bacterium]
MSDKIQKRSSNQGIQNALKRELVSESTSRIKTGKSRSNNENIGRASIKASARASLNATEKVMDCGKDGSIGGTGLDSVYRGKNNIKIGIKTAKVTVKTVKGTANLGKKALRRFNPKIGQKYSLKRTDSRILESIKKESIYKSKNVNLRTRTKSNSNKINSQIKRDIQTRKIRENNLKKSKVEEKLEDKIESFTKSDEIGDTGSDSFYKLNQGVRNVKETTKTVKNISDFITKKTRENKIRSYEKIKNKRANRFSKRPIKSRPRIRSRTPINNATRAIGRGTIKVVKKVVAKAIANPFIAILLIGFIALFIVINSASASIGMMPTTTIMASEDQIREYADYIAKLDQELTQKVEKMKVGHDSYRVDILSLDGTIRSNVNEFMALIAVVKKQNFKFSNEEKALIKEVHKKLYSIDTEIEVSTSTSVGEDGKETTTTTRTLVITVECLPMNYILDDYLKSEEEMELFNLLATSGMSEFEDFDVTPVNPNMSQREFIERVAVGAKKGWEQYKIYPSITIAQAIIESGWGKSGLTKKANNLFGIKAIGNWKGPYVEMKTGEYGGKVTIVAKFRKYPSWDDSMVDHANFLFVNKRYTKAGVFKCTNYIDQIRAIHRAGYATDPNYSSTIISVVKKYGLQVYDQGGKLPPTATGSGSELVNYARKFLGVPYVWGGTSPSGFDCSGFTQYVCGKLGVRIPRTSKEQANFGNHIGSKSNLQVGDLVFFGKPTSHVGIYTGNGNYIHSPRTGDVVKEVPMTRKDFTHGRRVIK